MPAKRSRRVAAKPRPDPVLVRAPFLCGDAYSRRIACELAFGDAFGPALVLGEPPSYVLAGLGAHASGVVFAASPKRVRAVKRALSAAAPAWSLDGSEGLSDVVCGSLVVCSFSSEEPEEELERALGALADGAHVLIDTPRAAPNVEKRLTRILQGAAEAGRAVRPPFAPPDRFVLTARRRSPFPADAADEAPGVLPLTVVFISRDRREAEEPLADLLVRQNLPPAAVFVLDLAPTDDLALPDDLFGLVPAAATAPALLRKRGETEAEALNDALSGVDLPFTAIVLPEAARFAPNHLAALGMALEADPEAGAVCGDVAHLSADGAFARLSMPDATRLGAPAASVVLHGSFPLSSVVWRTSFLRELGGFDPGSGLATAFDLRLRAAQRRAFTSCPLPTTALRAASPSAAGYVDDRSRVVAAALERESPADAAAECGEVPEERRVAAGFARQARLFAAAARPRLAASRAQEALRRDPGSTEAAALLVRALVLDGRVGEAASVAEKALDPRTAAFGAAYVAASQGKIAKARDFYAAAAAFPGDPLAAEAGAVAVRLLGDPSALADWRAFAARAGVFERPEAALVCGAPPPAFGDDSGGAVATRDGLTA